MVDQTEIEAMAEIMQRLSESAQLQAGRIVDRATKDQELEIAMNTHRIVDGVSISKYDIRVEKKVVGEGFNKNFYHIYDRNKKSIVYQDISLFESAMGIARHDLFTKNHSKRDRLIELDSNYMGCVVEAHMHKCRITRLNENAVGYDVAQAKYSNVISRLSKVKKQILTLI